MRILGLCGLLCATSTWAVGQDLVIEPAGTTEVAQPALEAPPAPAGDEWTIQIRPKATANEAGKLTTEYARLYDAIPFSRAEWLANASYRHDSAMALLTGQPINGRTAPTRLLEEYQDPRTYRRTFFPRLSPADIHYQYGYGYRFGRFGFGWPGAGVYRYGYGY